MMGPVRLEGRWRAAIVVAMVVLVLGAIAFAAWPRSRDLLIPSSGVLFGAYVRPLDSYLTSAKRQAVRALEDDVGHTLAVDHHYYPWGVPFPSLDETLDEAAGRVPLISWHGTSTEAIRSGTMDRWIVARADAVKSFGHPVFLRWAWEMDGDRNAWWVGSPQSYVAAWIHIRRIFDREGATNAVWVWCPSAEAFDDHIASAYYPGNAYVDWVCADGYNWAPTKPRTSWRSFAEIFAPFYAGARPTGKPIMIGETGVLEGDPGAKAAWLNDVVTTLRTQMPAVKAFLYFSSLTENDGLWYDWRVDTSPSSYDAFIELARDPLFDVRAP